MSRISSKNSRVTLRDIAEAAGVSVSTVSYVLSGKAESRRISSQVAERVQEIARQQDYSPNLLVRSLQQGQTHILALHSAFGGRHSDDLYMDRLTNAVERAAGARHYDILVQCDFTRSAEETYRFLTGGHCDGVLFFGPQTHDSKLLSLLRASRLPTVIIGHQDEEGVLSGVSEDTQSGMQQVADELVALGHRRIAAFSAMAAWKDSADRISALKDNLERHGLELPPENVIFAPSSDIKERAKILEKLIEQADPTAIFCWHDRAGYRWLEVCEYMGIEVPNQISFVGYDGLHWPSTCPHVLASVKVDLEEFAKHAVELLDDLVHSKRKPPVKLILPITFSHGTTLAKARK